MFLQYNTIDKTALTYDSHLYLSMYFFVSNFEFQFVWSWIPSLRFPDE